MKHAPMHAAFVTVACLFAAPAAAHSTIEGANDFMAGAVHVLTAPEHVLAIVALALLAAQKGWEKTGPLALVFPAAFAVAAFAGATNLSTLSFTTAAELSIIALGIWVALARSTPSAAFVGISLVIGAIHGAANGAARLPQMSLLAFVAGASFAALAALAITVIASDWALRMSRSWPSIAVRALGSWIAAIAMLSLALSYRATA